MNRNDLPNEKALTDIIMFDKNNNQIKKAILNYDYFQSPVQTDSPFSKRLKLDKVVFQGNNTSINEVYKMTYNLSSSLPLRMMAVTDLFGYNNGYANNFQYNIANNEYVVQPPFSNASLTQQHISIPIMVNFHFYPKQ